MSRFGNDARASRARLSSVAMVSLAAILISGGAICPTTAAGSDGSTTGSRHGRARDCRALAGTTLVDVRVSAATRVARAGAVPGYCRVLGTEVGTEHDIEVRLPDTWRNRYVQNGGGGFDGRIGQIPDAELRLGAVAAANNGGHRDPSGEALRGDRQAQVRYAHAAIETTARFSKKLSTLYFGREPSFSYYQGCSNGGRGALNAAAKYAGQFDGVIAGAPTLNLTGQIAAWTRTAALQLPSREKVAAIQAEIVSRYDRLDGLTDGIVSNVEAVDFDPTTDIPAEIELTKAESEAVTAVMNDVTAFGETVYSRYSVPGAGGADLGVGHMRNLVLNDATWDPASFDVETYLPTIHQVVDLEFGFSPSAEGLADFLREGNKVMLWHGTQDPLLSENDTLRKWDEVRHLAGAGVADANSRVYLAPGVEHCGGGPGADTFDLLPKLMSWVESDVVPGNVVASKVDRATGARLFTRPLCEYPTYPRYSGRGDPDVARNFGCVRNAPDMVEPVAPTMAGLFQAP